MSDPATSGLGELGLGMAGPTLAVLLLLVVALLGLRVAYGARRGRARGRGPLAVLAQVELGPSQSLYLVRAAGRCLLVGGGGSGLGLIAELDPGEVEAAAVMDAGMPWEVGTVGQRLRTRIFGAAPLGQANHAQTDHAQTDHAQADHAAPLPRRADLKVS